MAEHPHQSPVSSKKFISYLLYLLLMKPILAFSIYYCKDSPHLLFQLIPLAIIIVDGFVVTGYILGQAGLDKYVQISQIAADAGMGIISKDISFNPKSLTAAQITQLQAQLKPVAAKPAAVIPAAQP